MKELGKDRYPEISSLFMEYSCHQPLFHSVLDGNHDGGVYADDGFTSFMVYVKGIWSYFAGLPNSAFIEEASSLIFDKLPAELTEIVLFSPDEVWRSTLDAALARRKVIRIARHVFDFEPDSFSAKAQHAVRPSDVDASVFEAGEGGNFGIKLLRGNQLLSECRSVFIGKAYAEIDVHTEEAERGKGYAFLACVAFIEECLRRGYTPCWGCWPYNEPSRNLALKLGFRQVEDLPAHYWAPNM